MSQLSASSSLDELDLHTFVHGETSIIRALTDIKSADLNRGGSGPLLNAIEIS